MISLLLSSLCSQILTGSKALAYEIMTLWDVDWNLSGRERNWKYISVWVFQLHGCWLADGSGFICNTPHHHHPAKKTQKTNPNKQKNNTNDKEEEEMVALNLQLPELTRCALRLDTKAKPCRGQENRQNQQLVPAFQSLLGRTYAQDFSNGGNSRHAQRHRSLCLGNANSNREVSLGTSSIRQPPSGNVLDCNLKCR